MLPMRKSSIVKRALGAVLWLLAVGLPPCPGQAQTLPVASPASAPSAPVPVEAFFANADINAFAISPDARHVAFLAAPATQRMQLMVLDTETLAAKAAAGFANAQIVSVHWVSDRRIVFSVSDGRLFGVDADGSNLFSLVPPTHIAGAINKNARLLATTYEVNSDDVFVTDPRYGLTGVFEAQAMLRVSTRTGHSDAQVRPGKSISWSVDAQNVPRATVVREGEREAFYYFDPATKDWVKLADWERFSGAGFSPAGFAPDGTMYVASRNGRDTTAIYRYDIAKRAMDSEPLVSMKGYDFDGYLLQDRSGIVGVRYGTDAQATAWFDTRLKQVQAQLDVRLPDTINTMVIPFRPELPFVLVHSFSDVHPGALLLLNTKTEKLVRLATARRGIDPQKMAHRELVHYKARDGLEIPAWLTLPPGAKADQKLPMVVLVHAGAWSRGGYWAWYPESQFLASRGYAVLEPEFRGSTGFGERHFRASWKQWGLAMQDDLADGARWSIARGTADPARICIAGADYGGYAALMGLVKDPDLFRCGIDLRGMTDIDLMYSIFWSGVPEDFKSYGMPVLIGDREKDAARLKAASPLQQAARIKAPLLLAYGELDRSVPIDHGRKLYDAVRKTNADVEWIEYPEEGHDWTLVKNRIDFWTRVEKFLDRNIGTK
jgi:dipeptidyl aminopeptidase/acylaminoacyl peptidase